MIKVEREAMNYSEGVGARQPCQFCGECEVGERPQETRPVNGFAVVASVVV